LVLSISRESFPDRAYEVFVSYHWRDHPAVEALARALREAGIRVFLDRWYLNPGRPWPQGLEAALGSCGAVVVCLGPGEMGPWQQREVNLALERQSKDMAFPVIPVLLPGAEPVLGFLGQNTWVDLRERSNNPVSISILAAAIRGSSPGLDAQAYFETTAGAICPYRGLLFFREEDAPFFFGREQAVKQLIGVTGRSNFVAVVGASGCGKSSVVRAGLLPTLRRSPETVWEIATVIPGDRPLRALAAVLSPLLEPDMTEADRLIEINKLARGFETAEIELRDVVERVLEKQPGTGRLLIVADQWEELYTLTSDETVRRRFIDELLDASASTPLTVVLTLRGDFVGHALAYRPLSDRLQGAQVNLGPMSRNELAVAIEEPAEKINLEFEPGLAERILDDAGQEPGNLPLLEFVLKQLWNSRCRGQLLHAAYEEIGGLQGAVASKADEIYANLTPPERHAVRRIFLQLATPAEQGGYTRRRANFTMVSPGLPVLKRLTDARLLVTSPASGDDEGSVELSHEALIHNWDRFGVWLDEDREFLLWRRRFTQLVDVWRAAGQAEDRLLAGALLVEAEKWLNARADDISGHERDFITASATYHKREQAKLRRGRLAFVTVIAALALAALLFAINSEREKRRANAEADHSLALQLAAQSGKLTNARVADALLLGIAAVSQEPIYETRDNLFRQLRSVPAGLESFQWGHTGSVLSMAFSPDGSALATGDGEANVILWNMASRGSPGIPLRGHTGAVWSVAFDPDGKTLATASQDGSVILWDVATRKPVGAPLKWPNGVVKSVVFTPNGKRLIVIDENDTAGRWDVASRSVIEGELEDVWKIAFTPKGGVLTVVSRGLTVGVWDSNVNHQLLQLSYEYSGPPLPVSFSADGKTLAVADPDETTVSLWDVASGKRLGEPLKGHGAGISNIAFSPDGKTLATGSRDESVILWDVESGKQLGNPLRGHASAVMTVAFSPDGRTLATGSNDHTVILWDVARTQHPRETIREATGQVNSVAFSPDGKTLAVAGWDAVVFWDLVHRERIGQPLERDGVVETVAFSEEGKNLAAAFMDGTFIRWDVLSRNPVGEPLIVYQPTVKYRGSVHESAFSADGKTLALAGFDGRVVLWDAASRNELGELPKLHNGPVKSVAFSRDGRMFATGGEDHRVILWDVASRKALGTPLQGHTTGVESVAFTPDGKMLASGSSNGVVILWDTATLKAVGAPFSGQNGAIMSIAFNAEQTVLATGSTDRKAILWDIASRKPLGDPLLGHSAEVHSIAFSSDGETLATGSWDSSVILWDITTGAESMMARACRMVNRNFTESEWAQYMGKRPYRKVCPTLPGPGADRTTLRR
jgi:WD40 repeat protein/KaiC/GvpD/RAD55 family RecA-like ATPase